MPFALAPSSPWPLLFYCSALTRSVSYPHAELACVVIRAFRVFTCGTVWIIMGASWLHHRRAAPHPSFANKQGSPVYAPVAFHSSSYWGARKCVSSLTCATPASEALDSRPSSVIYCHLKTMNLNEAKLEFCRERVTKRAIPTTAILIITSNKPRALLDEFAFNSFVFSDCPTRKLSLPASAS